MKTVVISGASSGIGQTLVETFSQNQWQVLMVARNQEKLELLKQTHPHCDFVICDLSKPDVDLTSVLKDKVGTVDALINNAGIYRPKPIDDSDESAWDDQWQTNLMGAVRLTNSLWSSLKKSKGTVVNISSTLAIRPIANTAAYAATKAAMNSWTLSLALEGAPFGISANAICPGIIDTPIHGYFESSKPEDIELHKQLQGAQPLGRTGKTTDISGMALHLCQPESNWTTGTIINIDGGILLNS